MASTNKDKLKELLGKIAVSTNTITVEDDINHYTILELINALRSNVKELDTNVKELDKIASELEQGSIDNIITYDTGTSTVQELIDKASTTSHYVKLQPKVYEIETSIKPKSNVILDLNGATLHLKNGVEKPMFNKDGNLTNFAVINGKLDLNQANNHALNQSSGGLWILNADHLYFANLEIIHAFRNIFNFYTCTDVTIKDIYCKDCGMANDDGYFTYGASFERQCKNIEIDNFNMINIYGYGIHLRKTTQAKLTNIHFQDFVRPSSSGSGTSIGITFTEADNVVVDNYTHINGDGLSIECNQSSNIVMNNFLIDNVKVPFVFGTNASDQSEERNTHIKINNLVTTNSTGTCSLRLNYLNGLVIDNFDVDKGLETLTDIESKDIIFKNGKFGTRISKSYHNERYHFINVEFPTVSTNFPTVILKNYNARNSNEIWLPTVRIDPGSYKQMHLGTEILNLRGTEPIFFKLLVFSNSTSTVTKATFTEYMVILYGESSAVYLKEVSSLNGEDEKKITVEVNTSKQGLKFSNNTTSVLDVRVKTY